MRRCACRAVAAIVAGLAGAAAPVAGALAPAPAPQPLLRLSAAGGETGWISLTVSGPDGATVDVAEQVGARRRPVRRLALDGATAELRHAARWRCERRERHFVATATATADAAGGRIEAATASVTTPSCAHRLRVAVVPEQVRPGGAAVVRIADAWGFGGISARVCARSPPQRTSAGSCRRLRLAPGSRTRRARVRLARPGRWRITVARGTERRPFSRQIEVGARPRLRILVAGDSMIFGLFEALGTDLRARADVHGDAHPGQALTTPHSLDWPAHARVSARATRPDVTIMLVGAAGDGYPLRTPAGETVPCCEAGWIAAYARRARGMMRTYARGGRGLVYWVLPPAPRGAAAANIVRAENAAAREAGRGLGESVAVIGRIADVLTPLGTFAESIVVGGRRRVVRDSDGVHLTAPGIRVATNILTARLRLDGLLPTVRPTAPAGATPRRRGRRA